MIPREYEALLQDVLDGVATPEQERRLAAFLSRDEGGRQREDELRRVFQALGRVPAADAPADLRESVLAAIRERAASRRTRPAPWGSGFRWRLATVFAGGLAAGMVTMGALTGVLDLGRPGGEPPVSGTMMPARPPSSGDVVRRSWNVPGSRVDAVAWRVGRTRLVTLQVRSEGEAEVELAFDPGSLAPESVRQSGVPTPRISMEPGRVLLRSQDRAEYVVELDGPEPHAPVRVVLRSGAARVGGELPPPPAR